MATELSTSIDWPETGLWEVMTRIPENIKSANQDPPGLVTISDKWQTEVF